MSLKSKLPISTLIAAALVMIPALAFAQEGGVAAANKFTTQSWIAGAAGFAIGLAALGGTIGQGRAISSALEGISRNPGAAARIQTPLILGLAFVESLVLFTWAIAFLLQLKLAS